MKSQENVTCSQIKSTDANGEVVRMVASADRSFKAAIITVPREVKDVHDKWKAVTTEKEKKGINNWKHRRVKILKNAQ